MKKNITYIGLIICVLGFTFLSIYNQIKPLLKEEVVPVNKTIDEIIEVEDPNPKNNKDKTDIHSEEAETQEETNPSKITTPSEPPKEKKTDTEDKKNDEVKQEEVVKEPTEEEINDTLRKSIESKYGINIKYGHEMDDYQIAGIYTPTYLTDTEIINKNLKNVDNYLGYYPTGFFKEIKNFGMPLTIFLVKNIPGSGMAGIADKEFYDNIRITVCTDSFFFRVLHHEIFHYVEAYMETISYYKGGIFNNWDGLNPEGFSYGNTNSLYSYSLLDTTKIPYFINDYGQTNEREDRATIFEDLMARTSETNNSFVSPNPIWSKGKMICEELDKWFSSVNSSTERWERFIYN